MTAKEKLKQLYIQKDKDYNKYRAFCIECNLVTVEELDEIEYNILPFEENLKLFEDWLAQK